MSHCLKLLFLITLLITSVSADIYRNTIGMTFVQIPAGHFMMGTTIPPCPLDDPSTPHNEYKECIDRTIGMTNKDETPAHLVTLPSFYMQTTEVTQGQWLALMGHNPAKYNTGDPMMPVENVSWFDAKAFVKKLNEIEHTNKYRLPTEAEWEYAARAGSMTKWPTGDDERMVGQIAVCNTASPQRVASKKPNSWKLYDMHGNVWEWVEDCRSLDYLQASPLGEPTGSDCRYRANRGGSWGNQLSNSRSSLRGFFTPESKTSWLGFRVVWMP